MFSKRSKDDSNSISIIQRNRKDDSDDGADSHVSPAPASPFLLELASSNTTRDVSAPLPPPAPMLTLRKRRADADADADRTVQDINDEKTCQSEKFAMTSYNSAFLQGIFQDIAEADEGAATSKAVMDKTEENESRSSHEPDKPVLDVIADTGGAAVAVSQHNLTKRRRISTVSSIGTARSLGLSCGKSQSNLAIYSQADTKKESSHFFLPAVAMPQQTAVSVATKIHVELPATVSTSYSFQSQGQTETSSSSSKGLMVTTYSNSILDNTTTHEISQQQQGDFGWYVDTDCDDGRPTLNTSSILLAHSSTATAETDLAFSACVAPRQDPTKKQKAEVEWAAAADMVDDLLGDFF